MKVLDCAQRSPEWFAARAGVFTASSARDMLATIAKGEAASRRDLRLRLVLERLTGTSQESGYVNADMQRGIDKEPDAIAAYEALTGDLIRPVGFILHDTLKIGCSPDGIVGENVGGVELKCPRSATHLEYLRAKTLPKDYLGQIHHSLLVTGFAWWDFLSFDDRFPEPLRTFYVRVTRDDIAIKSYEVMARLFLNEVDKELDAVSGMAAAGVAF